VFAPEGLLEDPDRPLVQRLGLAGILLPPREIGMT
jgi:hypothetical protein